MHSREDLHSHQQDVEDQAQLETFLILTGLFVFLLSVFYTEDTWCCSPRHLLTVVTSAGLPYMLGASKVHHQFCIAQAYPYSSFQAYYARERRAYCVDRGLITLQVVPTIEASDFSRHEARRKAHIHTSRVKWQDINDFLQNFE
eukprot:scaffold44314_cov16-Tisochrysis_lutea.AAC.1